MHAILNTAILKRLMATNSSEARLAELTRNTFLSMWAYQNPYFAKAKELCDVLIIFGNDVILISDKRIAFNQEIALEIAWTRWYKKAVESSVRQLRGALRQIQSAPHQIYVDSLASSPFPLQLPAPDEMRVHLIAVANGCEDACLKVLGHPGLRIDTQVQDGSRPFTVGIHYPEFVHVISRPALDALFTCMDTARDLLDYLIRKQRALTDADYLIEGEEELVGAYMRSQQGDRPYSIPVRSLPSLNDAFHVRVGTWNEYTESDLCKKRKAAQRPSYVIDRLIEHLAEEYRQRNLVIGQQLSLQQHEAAFRLIAAESRLGRQLVTAGLYEILDEDPNTFWSTVTTSPENPDLLYVWLTYPEIPYDVSDDEFEEVLLSYLSQHMLVARRKFREAKRIFGIAIPNLHSNRNSRIFRVLDGTIWTQDMAELAEELELELGILSNLQTTTHFSIR